MLMAATIRVSKNELLEEPTLPKRLPREMPPLLSKLLRSSLTNWGLEVIVLRIPSSREALIEYNMNDPLASLESQLRRTPGLTLLAWQLQLVTPRRVLAVSFWRTTLWVRVVPLSSWASNPRIRLQHEAPSADPVILRRPDTGST